MSSEGSKNVWKKLLSDVGISKDVYLCGACTLAHNLDLNCYMSGANTVDYVSLLYIVNVTGADKRELLMVGKDILETEENVCSLPVNYYYSSNGLLNYSAVLGYLSKWDKELDAQGKCITLLLTESNSLIQNANFKNIRIPDVLHLDYFNYIKQKIVECFKYQYRKLQISRSLTHGKNNCTFLDYVHMIGMAWNNVPPKYIQSICLVPETDSSSQFLDYEKDSDCDFSLAKWCKQYNVPLNVEMCTDLLDKYVACDAHLPCIYYSQLENIQTFEVLSQKSGQPTSGIDAYQAMKRIISYLHAESVSESIIKYAKYLENHLEYGALLQMHQIIASNKNSM